MGTRGFIGYKYNNEIKGWYNHFDSYPSGVGDLLIEATQKMNQNQLKDFFLNRITFVDQDDTKYREEYENHKSVWEIDWKTDSIRLQDGLDFYKDGLFCEYSYIFDLDAKYKTLLLFKGFGEKPAKGYEDWYYESDHDSKKHYIKPIGKLRYKRTQKETYARMVIAYESKSDDEETVKAAQVLKKVLDTKKENLPLLIGEVQNLKAEYGESKELAKEFLDKKLRRVPV